VCTGQGQGEDLQRRLPRVNLAGARVEAVGDGVKVPLGRYWRISPCVFSQVPRCQGLCGSQKYTRTPAA